MEKIEREALDFMNVESSSQLPFIRPVKEKPIRLFGKEFGGGSDNANTMITTNMSDSIDNNLLHDKPKPNKMNISANCIAKRSHVSKNDKISRKYECYYCFKNFPTSQALGGHQNAHKKEHQIAKRDHHQSSIVHETNIMNRHCLGEAVATRFYGIGYNIYSPLAIPPAVHHDQNNNPLSSHNSVFSNDEKEGKVQDQVSLDLHL